MPDGFSGSHPSLSGFQRNYNRTITCNRPSPCQLQVSCMCLDTLVLLILGLRSQVSLQTTPQPALTLPHRCQNPCLGSPVPAPNTLGAVSGIGSTLFPSADWELCDSRAWGLLGHRLHIHSLQINRQSIGVSHNTQCLLYQGSQALPY